MTKDEIVSLRALAQTCLGYISKATHAAAIDYAKELATLSLAAVADLERYRQHAERPNVVNYDSLNDMERVAHLYTHDMALPSSTSGEVVLARSVLALIWRVRELHLEICTVHADVYAEIERAAGENAPRVRCAGDANEAIRRWEARDNEQEVAIAMLRETISELAGFTEHAIGCPEWMRQHPNAHGEAGPAADKPCDCGLEELLALGEQTNWQRTDTTESTP